MFSLWVDHFSSLTSQKSSDLKLSTLKAFDKLVSYIMLSDEIKVIRHMCKKIYKRTLHKFQFPLTLFSQFSVVPASAKTTNKDRKMPVLKRGNREHVKIKPDSGSVTPGYRLHALVIDEIFLSKTSKGHVARV